MYNLLIVDDETRVREGLKKLINWEELGFRVIGDVESAGKALDFIEENRVDAVLTDIIMPDIDGLELIRKLKEINPDIKTVILSGYGEFQFAQKALRLGAYDFLIKPVDFEDLKRIFRSIQIILSEEIMMRDRQKEYLKLEQEQFLNNLAKGFYSKTGSSDQIFRGLSLELNMDCYSVIRFFITKPIGISTQNDMFIDYSSIKSDIISFISRYLPEGDEKFIFNNDLREIAAIIGISDKGQCKCILEKLMGDLKSNLNYIVHIGVGSIYSDVLEISDSYLEAGRALEYRIVKKDSSVLFYEDILTFFKGQAWITDEIKDAVSYYLVQTDEEGLIRYIDEILDHICNSEQISVNNLYDACIEFFLTINRFLSSTHGEIKNSQANDRITIRNLLEKDSFEDIKELMHLYIMDSMKIIRGSKDKTTGLIIENAKRYIQEHFNEDITLGRLSEVLYIHPNYLSKLFKEKTGENFVDFLTRARIEKSKALLKDVSLKIYEIAEMTGFCNPKYYGMTFKELVGITPREFRDAAR